MSEPIINIYEQSNAKSAKKMYSAVDKHSPMVLCKCNRQQEQNSENICSLDDVLQCDSLEKYESSFNEQKNNLYNPNEPLKLSDHPTIVISKFCKMMYDFGWATGTGGGMSVKSNNCIYMAPSGVHKEMIQPKDIFECDVYGNVLHSPSDCLKLTECAPLFMNAYNLRNAGAVIHSHSIYCVLASLLFKGKEFRITGMEMMKGIKKGMTTTSYKNNDMLVVPIIENTLYERDLTKSMKEAMEMYPDSNAIIVRRHGVYIWGPTWERVKSQSECYHYLFEIAVKMKQLGFQPDDGLSQEHEL